MPELCLRVLRKNSEPDLDTGHCPFPARKTYLLPSASEDEVEWTKDNLQAAFVFSALRQFARGEKPGRACLPLLCFPYSA